MHADQLPYRKLYTQILDYGRDALYDDVLRPWLARNGDERRWLDGLRAVSSPPVPKMRPEESWRLYALSRIIDLLQLSFAPRADDAGWDIPALGADELAGFMDALGLERIDRAAFHPFFHEIVTVDQAADASASPEITGVCWPGYTLGPLLISRAGCNVRAGRDHLAKETAERSTLYWAFARNNRPCTDLSRGWGSNSQWRTSFRRDYVLGGQLLYNVDAAGDTSGDEDLDAGERLELLRHRCFVLSTRQSDDRWPYGLTHAEPA